MMQWPGSSSSTTTSPFTLPFTSQTTSPFTSQTTSPFTSRTTPSFFLKNTWPFTSQTTGGRSFGCESESGFAGKESYKPPHTPEEIDEYMRAKAFGVYDDSCDADGQDASSWEARKLACSLALSVVGVCCPTAGLGYLCSSGIVVEWNGVTKILTSAYVLGRPPYGVDREVHILLPNEVKVIGKILYVDEHHNVALIDADFDGMTLKGVTFGRELLELDDAVTAVGRQRYGRLLASQGRINIRGDHLESDDLMSSSCRIAEWGIGGPLISNSSGKIIGMNFYNRQGCTPFMPGILLWKCVEHFFTRGRVIRPGIGLKIRSINELKTNDRELEMIYLSFGSIGGLIVRQVMEGSPAHEAGIKVGDIIISCNGTRVSSPIEVAHMLFEMVEKPHGVPLHDLERKSQSIEVVIQRVDSTHGREEVKSIPIRNFVPAVINSWPLVPPPYFYGRPQAWG